MRKLLFAACAFTSISMGCGGEGAGGISNIGEGAEDVVVCPGATVEGIDVSEYQGGIDWGAVKASGRAFAIARVGDGMYQDPTFATNWNGIKAAGLVRGVYQFFRPEEDPTAQANILVSKVGVLGSGDLPATLDVEVVDGQSPATINSHIHAWADRVTAGTGRAPMIYVGKYFWNDNVGSGDFAGNPLWIAAWGPPCPDLPNAWHGWRMWQYADNGRVGGIGGNVDLDKFNGSQSDLLAFAGGPDWAAAYVNQSWPLATMALTMKTGEQVPAFIELRNTGQRTWDGNTKLASSDPRDRQSPFADRTWLSKNRVVAVSGTVPPGGSFRFSFTFHAPQAPGDYHEHFNLVEEGVHWFSDPGQGGPPDSQIEAWIKVVPGPPPPPDLALPPHTDGGTADRMDGGSGDADVGVPTIHGGCSCQVAGRTASRGIPVPVFMFMLVLAAMYVRRARR